jgi:hypothetical protein
MFPFVRREKHNTKAMQIPFARREKNWVSRLFFVGFVMWWTQKEIILNPGVSHLLINLWDNFIVCFNQNRIWMQSRDNTCAPFTELSVLKTISLKIPKIPLCFKDPDKFLRWSVYLLKNAICASSHEIWFLLIHARLICIQVYISHKNIYIHEPWFHFS